MHSALHMRVGGHAADVGAAASAKQICRRAAAAAGPAAQAQAGAFKAHPPLYNGGGLLCLNRFWVRINGCVFDTLLSPADFLKSQVTLV